MLPSKNDVRWKKLVKGEIVHSFKSYPVSMMLSRHKREISKDSSPQAVSKLVDEAYSFFEKYESILGDDIKAIFS